MSTDQNQRSNNQNRSGQPRRRNNNKGNYNKNKNSNSNSHRRGVPPRKSERQAPPKLTGWQKFLKAIGLYKQPTATTATSHRGDSSAKSSNSGNNAQSNNRGPKPASKNTTKKRAPRESVPQAVDSTRLYVGNLSYEVTEGELIDLFKGFGNVKKAEVVYNKRTQRSKGFAFVEMMNVDDAKRACEVLHEQPFMGRNMIVNGARSSAQQASTLEDPAA